MLNNQCGKVLKLTLDQLVKVQILAPQLPARFDSIPNLGLTAQFFRRGATVSRG